MKTAIHEQNVAAQNEKSRIQAQITRRNQEIGRKIGSIAYFFFYYKLPYLLFEKFLPLLCLNGIDIGQINHSEIFLRRLLDPCFTVLQKRLRKHINEILSCTGEERHITLLLDKGTIKHDTSQLTLIRTPCLKSGVLFESFFVGNPNVLSSCGVSLTRLLINSILMSLDWTEEHLRKRFSGACVDGQYIHLNLGNHLSEMLSLPADLTRDSVTWDSAHRLELACHHAKEGYSVNKQRVGGTVWLMGLDVLQHIMKNFRFGHNHTDLRKIAKEQHQVFLEFNLFSETRFIQYAHRTCDHFVRMFTILCEKLRRDELAADTNAELADTEKLQNMLVQVELVVDLLFMTDLSHLLTFASKEFQRFDVLPFYAMTVYKDVRNQLISARESFNLSQAPQPICLPKTDYSKPYTAWKNFAECVESIIDTQNFQNVRLLVPSEKGRVTRSGAHFGSYRDGFRAIVMQRFKKYRIYLDLLLTELKNRFEPWPEWVELSFNAFHFQNEMDFDQRKESFTSLLESPFDIHPVKITLKKRIDAEYVTQCFEDYPGIAKQRRRGQYQSSLVPIILRGDLLSRLHYGEPFCPSIHKQVI